LGRERLSDGIALGDGDRHHQLANLTRFAALINKDHSSVLAPSLFTLLTGLVLSLSR
jgi:hypothetical protein